MPVDATDQALEKEIREAREALIIVASAEDRWWTGYELKVRARNGWSAGAMGLAMRELLEEGVFDQREDLCIRFRD